MAKHARDRNAGAAVIPTMRYHDAAAAVEWLCRAFGFEKLLVVPGAQGSVAHAGHRHAGSRRLRAVGSCGRGSRHAPAG